MWDHHNEHDMPCQLKKLSMTQTMLVFTLVWWHNSFHILETLALPSMCAKWGPINLFCNCNKLPDADSAVLIPSLGTLWQESSKLCCSMHISAPNPRKSQNCPMCCWNFIKSCQHLLSLSCAACSVHSYGLEKAGEWREVELRTT